MISGWDVKAYRMWSLVCFFYGFCYALILNQKYGKRPLNVLKYLVIKLHIMIVANIKDTKRMKK